MKKKKKKNKAGLKELAKRDSIQMDEDNLYNEF